MIKGNSISNLRVRRSRRPGFRRLARRTDALQWSKGQPKHRILRLQRRQARLGLRLELRDARIGCQLTSQECHRICGSRLRGVSGCRCGLTHRDSRPIEGGAHEGQ